MYLPALDDLGKCRQPQSSVGTVDMPPLSGLPFDWNGVSATIPQRTWFNQEHVGHPRQRTCVVFRSLDSTRQSVANLATWLGYLNRYVHALACEPCWDDTEMELF